MAALSGAPRALPAATTNWTAGGGGLWMTAGNWSSGVPVNQSDVGITAATTIGRTVSYNYFGHSITLNSLTLSDGGGGRGTNTLSQAQGTLTTEDLDISGGGIYDLSGGTNEIVGGLTVGLLGSSSNATYLLSGSGTLSSYDAIIGNFGTGIFTQSGGSNTIGTPAVTGSQIVRDLYLGYTATASGSYKLSGDGTLTVHGRAFVGYAGTGSFTQSGGTAIIGSPTYERDLYIGGTVAGSTGSYALSGTGALTVHGRAYLAFGGTGSFTQSGGTATIADHEFIHNGGTFNQTGGSHTAKTLNVIGPGASASLSGSGSLAVLGSNYVSQSATFTQSAGTQTSDMTGVINDGAFIHTGGTATMNYFAIHTGGSYQLSESGNLTALWIDVGDTVTGSVIQTGGICKVSQVLFVGNALTSNSGSSYALSGGELRSTQVGVEATGIFTHTGGVHTVGSSSSGTPSGFLRVYTGGTYSLALAGILDVQGSELIQGGSAGNFIQNGGQHGVTGYLRITGSYHLSSGRLAVGLDQMIDQSGIFNQSGGTNEPGSLTSSVTINAGGAYALSGGTLTTPYLTNRGTFNYTGGTLSTDRLDVLGAGVMTFPTAEARTLKLTQLTVANTARLDLKMSKLIVAGAGAAGLGSWNGSEYTGITGLLQSGRGDGSWNGSGIVTSMTDATNSVLTTLAVALAEDVGYVGGTFGGVSVNAGDVLVMYTYAGDADLSGNIDGDDFARIDAGYSALSTGYANGDFNYSGNIDADDYFIIDRNYSRQGSSFSAAPPVGVAAVPEPAAGALLLIAAGVMAGRRRRAG